ncbi:hypothetical protein EG328_003396 [Venturia inaequalis]|uniref:Uncharacterized protein n=1 Tax=Venturia inaequalis TaxID=5025 RepID=A0A8H3VK09_VENIN|nr:hypothetical protein EG328_003396 [Venturia inaequalis]KAE9989196.1 hypothetical protein EG327_002966 [Venturia inaequalis]RDI85276.1 hypothetical protein Vi05172_g4731 [Venturia inaequalis]
MMHALVLLAAMLLPNSSSIPRPLPQSADQRAIDFQPVMDYDKDVCYFTAAIDKDNFTAFGLESSNDFKQCRQTDRLDSSNAYVRSLCNHGWCAYMYAYYAEKQGENGHPHDWQHAIAWTTQDQGQNRTQQEELHSISWSNDGGYSTKPISDKDVHLYNETHVKLDYHQRNKGSRIELRLAKREDDMIENSKGMWHQAPLVNITSDAPKLFEVEFGYAKMDFKDPLFARALKKSMPKEAKSDKFNPGRV